MLEIIVLSLIQGITEFIPVSSSSHLIIVSEFLNFTKENLLTNISLHIGSFVAVIIFFRHEIKNFFKYKKLFFLILFSSIPVLSLGLFLVKFEIINHLRGIKIIGWTTLIFGILLFISDKSKSSKKLDNFDLRSAIIIGLFHALSLIPGVSRSGIAITFGRFLGFNRVDSAKISFLLSVPVLLVISLYGFYNLHEIENISIKQINFIAILLSGVFSYFTIVFFLKFLKRFDLIVFVIYRIILGFVLLCFSYL
ncbi:MAG: UDP-diphosphatase [Pelagibacteraceae bacterium TMED287]|nr:MAG: UDP-diphosphatase [Pelagibacteraceae bacterium TMED287]